MALKCLLSTVFVITSVTGLHAADPEFNAGLVVKATAKLLEVTHLKKKPLDDARSEAWLEVFLATLDPRKVYFLQSDIDEFGKWKHSLDNYAKTGDMRFANYVRARYQKRVAEAHKLASVALKQSHDYAIDEDWPLPCESHVRTSEELADRWRLRIKGELLFEKAHRFSDAEAKAFLRGRYDRIAKQSREMNDERLCEAYLDALATVYDPHSDYIGEETLASFRVSGWLVLRPHLRLRTADGRLLISDVTLPRTVAEEHTDLIGWELIAIRFSDDSVAHLVDMSLTAGARELYRWVSNSGVDVILELQQPSSMQRKSVSWPRYVEGFE